MTAIAIWINEEIQNYPSLWVVADSRVSSGSGILIEDGAKIFTLPIICKKSGKDSFFTDNYYQHSVGFCFAGSTLMGQNSFLSLQPLLSNLFSVEGYIPSLEEIANYILSYLKQTFDDYKVVGASNSMLEAAIFGYCHVTSKLCVFHFLPEFGSNGCFMTMKNCDCKKTSDFVYLGDKKSEMIEKIKVSFKSESIPGRPVSRVPRYVIEDEIQENDSSSIGGDIQLGIAGVHGFSTYKICKPYKKGEPKAYFSYLGRELTEELSHVGNAIVGGNAIV